MSHIALATYMSRPTGASTTRAALQALAKLGHTLVPTTVAIVVCAFGVMLLKSGATPVVRLHSIALQHVLPGGTFAVSHLFGSIAGAWLLVLAWGLRRRLDAAWLMTVMLLGVGSVLLMLRGGDWTTTLALLTVVIIVLLSRRAFYRQALLVTSSMHVERVIAIVTMLGLSTWIGLLSLRYDDLNDELWWRTSLEGDAPHSLHVMLVGAVVLTTLAAAILLRPVRVTTTLPDNAQVVRAAAVAAHCLDPESNLALLGDKALLFAEAPVADEGAGDGESTRAHTDGFVQYRVEGQSWIAMGDPMVANALLLSGQRTADPHDVTKMRSDLAWRFKSNADAQGGWPVFYSVSSVTLPLYISLGLTLFKLGEMARVNLPTFSLDGGDRKRLRRVIIEVERTGATFEIVPAERVYELLPTLRAISNEWLAHKNVREKGFSLGYFEDAYMQRFPIAIVRVPDTASGNLDGDIVAFSNLWLGGGKSELATDLMRFSSRAPKGVMDYLFVQLMLWGKAEGFHSFNLGMAPLAGFRTQALAPLWSKAGGWLYQHGEHFYNYKGIRSYKEKFHPEWEPRFLASPGGLALPRILLNVATMISGGIGGMVRK